jgi:hypothetical protein
MGLLGVWIPLWLVTRHILEIGLGDQAARLSVNFVNSDAIWRAKQHI